MPGLTHADDDARAEVLLRSLRRMVAEADGIGGGPSVRLPSREGLAVEKVMTPREAFFAPAEEVPRDRAVGRVAAEVVSPYPPGVPVLVPGEVITREAVDYLASGAAAGMLVPDAADPSMGVLRVVRD